MNGEIIFGVGGRLGRLLPNASTRAYMPPSPNLSQRERDEDVVGTRRPGRPPPSKTRSLQRTQRSAILAQRFFGRGRFDRGVFFHGVKNDAVGAVAGGELVFVKLRDFAAQKRDAREAVAAGVLVGQLVELDLIDRIDLDIAGAGDVAAAPAACGGASRAARFASSRRREWPARTSS